MVLEHVGRPLERLEDPGLLRSTDPCAPAPLGVQHVDLALTAARLRAAMVGR